MKKTAKGREVREEARANLVLRLGAVVREDLHAFAIQMGMLGLQALLEDERSEVCGPRYRHDAGRRASRAGHTIGELVMGGRRVQVRRPRARTRDGHEVELPSWRAFSCEDPIVERAVEQMLVGVSTRKYARTLEPTPPEVRTRGTSKSAVSRRFVSKTSTEMDKWLKRDLSDLDLAVLMIDGLHIDDHVLIVALGIDEQGHKHVLGLREGATENAASCTALLSDIEGRGVRTDRTILAVIDGSKALAKAVRKVFGVRVLIQRCQAHKIRNVEEQLPDEVRRSVRQAIREAYRSAKPEVAKRKLEGLVRKLRDEHPGAAASLEEGLAETLTVKAFRLPEWLRRTLLTTNAIENLIGSVRGLTRRVRKWKDGRMMLRWTATALIEAAKRFHRVRDHAGMKTLVAALRAHDARVDGKEVGAAQVAA